MNSQTTVVITGANRGLGKALAIEFASKKCQIIAVCRDTASGMNTQAEIKQSNSNAVVSLLQADMSEPASIVTAAKSILAQNTSLDILVNNAAIFTPKRQVNSLGIELMFATNHLGCFLLTNLLMPALKASKKARILTLTAPSTVKLDFNDLQGAQHFSALHAFGASKMCNLLFSFALARHLEGTQIKVNAIHPGVMRTHLMQHAALPLRLITRIIGTNPVKAASPIVEFALGSDATWNGELIKRGKSAKVSPYARDIQMQEKLWQVGQSLLKDYLP